MSKKLPHRKWHLHWSIGEGKWRAKKILGEQYQKQRKNESNALNQKGMGCAGSEKKAKAAGFNEGKPEKPRPPWAGNLMLSHCSEKCLEGWLLRQTAGVQSWLQGQLESCFNDLGKKWRWLGPGLAVRWQEEAGYRAYLEEWMEAGRECIWKECNT